MSYAAVRRVFPRDAIVAGRARAGAAVVAVTDRVLARFVSIGDPGVGGVADDAAAFALFGGGVADAFLAWQREHGGLVRAAEIAVASAQWTHVRLAGGVEEVGAFGAGRARVLRRARPAVGLATRHAETRYGSTRAWSWLRRHVRAATPDELAGLRALAERTRAWVIRAALAYALGPVADVYTDADHAEARAAELDAPAHVRFGILAALRAHPFTEAALESIDSSEDELAVTTGQMIALGARAVVPLRFARAYGELRIIGDDHPDAHRALLAFADESPPDDHALLEIERLPARRATLAALAPMFATAAIPRLASSRAYFRTLVARDPTDAAELAPTTLAEIGHTTSSSIEPLWTARAPKLPAWLDVESLPRPAPLSSENVAQLLQRQKAGHDPNAATDLLAAEPPALALLAWTVFLRWLRAGAPPKEKWALVGLGYFGDDAMVTRLGADARTWAAGAHVARAQVAVEALALARSHAALVEIDAIARTAPSQALRRSAAAVLARVAGELGITADDLADRLVPELSLADLTFGDARVTFDPDLTPHLPDGPPDDPDGAARFAALAKLTKTVARGQQSRLERAMADAARMTYAHFSEVYLMHVLLSQLARGVVWGAYASASASASPPILFRIATDGTPVDVADRPLDLPVDRTYGVAHPVDFPSTTLASWRLRFPDQRVEQLARAAFPQTTAADCARALATCVGAFVRGATLRAALHRNWQRARSFDEGGRFSAIFRDGSHHDRTWSCTIRFDPGVPFQRAEPDESHAIASIELRAQGDPPPAILSELQRDLRALLTER